MPFGKNKIYLTVDFECINTKGTWIAYGAVLAMYPSGKIISSIAASCLRHKSEYDTPTMQFWKKHPRAHRAILSNVDAKTSIHDLELELCTYVRSILDTYPCTYVVSDNPQFDIRLLDNMLCMHNMPTVSCRTNNRYLPTLCTWSYRQGMHALRFDKHNTRFGVQVRESEATTIIGTQDIAHTPLFDCVQILYSHFRMLDLVAAKAHASVTGYG